MKMQTQKPTLKEPRGYLLMLVLARMVFFGVDGNDAAAADDEDCDLNGDEGIADAVAVAAAAAAASMTLSLTATKTMTTLNVML